MEKYRQFGDAGTGVHPFTPIWSSYTTPLVLRLLKVLIVPIALLRLLLFGVALLWLGLTEVLCMLIPVAALKFPVYRVLTYVGCFLALLALGIASTSDELADYRRLKLAPSKTSGATVFNGKRGTLIFANHQGLTDVLLLGLKVSPIFVIPASDGTPVQFSLLAALKRSVSCQQEVAPPNQTANLKEISAMAKSAWQQVVVFPEGSRTIGNAVLNWKPKTCEGMEPEKADAALLSIVYSKTGSYSPNHTVGTGMKHLFWLCMEVKPQTVKTVWLPKSELTAALKGKSNEEQTGLLRTLLVRMIPNCAEVAITADNHLDFMAFWDGAQKKGYTKQKFAGTQKPDREKTK